jgi:creatinine amidohydrolase
MAIDVGDGITSAEFDRMTKNYTRALVPVGSLEQHGRHLPVATDLIIASHITKLVAKRLGAFVLPPINYGISIEHSPLFNVSLRYSTLINLTHDISISLSKRGLKNVAHYLGQSDSDKEFSAFSLNYWNMMDIEFDHGGETETSIMLAIRSDYVRMDRAEPGTVNRRKLKGTYQTLTNNPGSFPKISKNGVWGDPRNATATKGQELLDQIIKNIAKVILELEDL